MAVLRQVAFLPGPGEAAILAALEGPARMLQLPRLHGNLPMHCYLESGMGVWHVVKGASRDLAYKHEALGLTISVIPASPAQAADWTHFRCESTEVAILFRAEWWKGDPDNEIGDIWEKVTANLAAVDEVPTRSLMGALCWVGLLLGDRGSPSGALYADSMPLSVGFTDNREQIRELIRDCRVVRARDLRHWMGQLKGWEVERMAGPE